MKGIEKKSPGRRSLTSNRSTGANECNIHSKKTTKYGHKGKQEVDKEVNRSLGEGTRAKGGGVSDIRSRVSRKKKGYGIGWGQG